MALLAFVVTSIVVPLLTAEFRDSCPWFARRLVRRAVVTLPPRSRARDEEEWLAELDELGQRKLAQLLFAFRILMGAQRTAEAIGGLPAGHPVAKRALDVLMASLVLAALAPMLLTLATLLRLTGAGPVIVRQVRVGRNGQPFSLYRFRTRRGAQTRWTRLLLSVRRLVLAGELRSRSEASFSRLGNLLRRTSLDELPQLVNIVRGDMSWVGPRAPRPGDDVDHEPGSWLQQGVQPGLTGLWAISGDHARADRMRALDRRYAATRSLRLDFKILILSVLKVIPCCPARRAIRKQTRGVR